METLAIHANEMTLKPFFGRLADETTHNPTSAGLAVTAATTHDHKEVNMKTQTNNIITLRSFFGRSANQATTDNPAGGASASSIARTHEKEIPMKRHSGSVVLLFAVLAFVFTFSLASNAEAKRVLITQPIDQSNLITLEGNVRPEATAANDRGRVAGNFAMNHMMLLLRRPDELQQAFEKYLEDLHDPASVTYYHWLTAKQIGQRYGLAQKDVNTINAWLQSQGFAVNTVYDNGILIDFSGTAAQVSGAFHTEIHQLDVHGERHIANMSDPQIPEALEPAIVGVVSLNDFMPYPATVKKTQSAGRRGNRPSPDYTFGGCGGNCYPVVPADLATIYNFPPHTAGHMGEGRTVVVVEDTDVYSRNDWLTFRSTFGLSSYGGTLTQVHPGPACTAPGVTSDDDEATLDVEWATAAAPAAKIVLASCSDTVIFGGFIALQNVLQETPLPDAVSISYTEAETYLGAAYNAYINDLYSSADAEGVSVYVAAGDAGAADADNPNTAQVAQHGINVNGFASTAHNAAVGGTDFEDTYLNQNGIYWSSTNGAFYGSAKSYIPEIPWNSSCGSALLAGYNGLTPLQLCNAGFFLTIQAGGGGPSACATGSATVSGVVSGSCAGRAKPFFQNSFLGIPADGVRDLPDVSLFAANGRWSHYYVFCFSDPSNGGVPCTPGHPNTWSGSGGTSFAAPIWAGIQALLNQKTNSFSGNPDYNLYSLAQSEYGSTGSAMCNSSRAGGPSPSCIFYDVTQGDMDVPCYSLGGTLYNCYQPLGSGTVGLLSTSNTTLSPAYGTQTGWDFATGIGTVNVQNLVNTWPPPPVSCWTADGRTICD
ncbi:MAG: protease pro-enzyme activation domain-containing protein [Candidatus Korobacteraceae bacterium]